jgi:very-short-patch-repair endonuclease
MRAPERTFTRAKRLRRDLSLPEVVLWQHLRGRHLAGLRFRRQHPVGPYILDFYCAESQLCVEVDGASHDNPERATHDERRAAWLEDRGIRVLRVPAAEVLSERTLGGVLKMIVHAAAPSTGFAGPPPPLRRGGQE